jgi:hypothetical protein
MLHLDVAVDDLGSNPMISGSIGTKMPPTLPNAAPKKPITEPSTMRHPSCIGCLRTDHNIMD